MLYIQAGKYSLVSCEKERENKNLQHTRKISYSKCIHENLTFYNYINKTKEYTSAFSENSVNKFGENRKNPNYLGKYRILKKKKKYRIFKEKDLCTGKREKDLKPKDRTRNRKRYKF